MKQLTPAVLAMRFRLYIAGLATILSASAAGTPLNVNLVNNNGAEANYIDTNGTRRPSGWTVINGLRATSSRPDIETDAGSSRKFGSFSFRMDSNSAGYQDVDVTELGSSIDKSALSVHVDGYLSDAVVTLLFLDASGNSISNLTASDSTGGFVYRENSSTIPNGTRKLRLQLGTNSYYGDADVLNLIVYSNGTPNVLLNVSTRGFVGGGDSVLIGGVIISDGPAKRVIFRAIGPSLSSHNVSGALPDPTLTIYNGQGMQVGANDDWQTDANASRVQASGIAPTDPRESAIFTTLQAGNYTAVVSGKDTTGVGVVEAYDIDQSGFSNFVNISTRGQVLTGNGRMIGGFILGGGNAHKVTSRGIGPSLASKGVPAVLADPQLDIRDAQGQQLYFNDDWQTYAAEATEASGEGLAPGDSKESAATGMLLPPGAYTAILQGANGGTGNGLVELYDLGTYPR